MTPSRGTENLSTSQAQSRLHGDHPERVCKAICPCPGSDMESCAQNPSSLSFCAPCWPLRPIPLALLAAGPGGQWLFLSDGRLPPCNVTDFARLGASLMTQMVKNLCNTGDPGSIPGSQRSPGEGNGNLLQYSCLENSMDRGAWVDCTVHGLAESDPTEQVVSHLGNNTT